MLLLLWGISRLSVNPNFLGSETPKLLFNFEARQLYEALVVGVILFPARRRILCDPTMLVVLECGLMLVPLIRVMHAVMITHILATRISTLGALLILGRVAALKRFHPRLNAGSRRRLRPGQKMVAIQTGSLT